VLPATGGVQDGTAVVVDERVDRPTVGGVDRVAVAVDEVLADD